MKRKNLISGGAALAVLVALIGAASAMERPVPRFDVLERRMQCAAWTRELIEINGVMARQGRVQGTSWGWREQFLSSMLDAIAEFESRLIRPWIDVESQALLTEHLDQDVFFGPQAGDWLEQCRDYRSRSWLRKIRLSPENHDTPGKTRKLNSSFSLALPDDLPELEILDAQMIARDTHAQSSN